MIELTSGYINVISKILINPAHIIYVQACELKSAISNIMEDFILAVKRLSVRLLSPEQSLKVWIWIPNIVSVKLLTAAFREVET